MLKSRELCKKLGVTQPKLTAWVKAGLPYTIGNRQQKLFDPGEVADWLVVNGHAQLPPPPPTIFTTMAEIAQALNVSTRTIGEWQTDSTFPGRAGHQGRQDGYYPLEEIRVWWQGRIDAGEGSDHSERARLLRLRADRQELELRRELGQVIDADDVERLLLRVINTTKAILEPLPDELLNDLPGDLLACWPKDILKALPKSLKEKMSNAAEGNLLVRLRARLESRMSDAFDSIAELLASGEEEEQIDS